MNRRWKRSARSSPCSKRRPRVYASKGPAVEEWADRWFFRPVGWRVANALLPTPISADVVTLMSLVLGVIAGHLMWYASSRINAWGVALFIVSDILDSADGPNPRRPGGYGTVRQPLRTSRRPAVRVGLGLGRRGLGVRGIGVAFVSG